MSACIGQPISWLRLETFALEKRDATVAEHLAACPVCARCLAEIETDVVALPPLAVPERAPRLRWLRFGVPAMALAAAAVVLLVVWRDREAPRRDEIAYGVKGVGDVHLEVVRERDGVTRDDVRTFAAGDRWKVVVTCPPAAAAWIDVVVDDAQTVDYPLAPALVTCGNRVVVPGAFAITGAQPNRVCIRVAAGVAPARARSQPGEPGVACVTLVPE